MIGEIKNKESIYRVLINKLTIFFARGTQYARGEGGVTLIRRYQLFLFYCVCHVCCVFAQRLISIVTKPVNLHESPVAVPGFDLRGRGLCQRVGGNFYHFVMGHIKIRL